MIRQEKNVIGRSAIGKHRVALVYPVRFGGFRLIVKILVSNHSPIHPRRELGSVRERDERARRVVSQTGREALGRILLTGRNNCRPTQLSASLKRGRSLGDEESLTKLIDPTPGLETTWPDSTI